MRQKNSQDYRAANHDPFGLHLLDATPQEPSHPQIVIEVADPRLHRILATLGNITTLLRAHPPAETLTMLFVLIATDHAALAGILAAQRSVGVTPHDLRRAYVTRLVRAGVPLPTVPKLVGPADIKTTIECHIWVNDGDLRASVAKLAG